MWERLARSVETDCRFRRKLGSVNASIVVLGTGMLAWAILAPGAPVSGAVVYEQLPLRNTMLDADGTVVRWADDFTLSQTAVVRSVGWWGAESNPHQPSSQVFSATLYADEAGQPGTVLSEFALARVEQAATGESIGQEYTEFIYSGLLEQPFTVNAGTRYWLSIVNPPAYTWAWEGSDRGGDAYVQVNGGPWNLEPSVGGAFALSTDVPEPSSVVLLTLALLLAALRAGLEQVLNPPASKRYRTKPRPLGLRRGFSYDNIGELLARVEGEDYH